MTATARAIPAGMGGATPYLCVDGAAEAIDFYRRAFGATETMRLADPKSSKIGHAEIQIGEATLMLADEYPEIDFRSPRTLGGSPVAIHLYIDDVDALFDRAVIAGATVLKPVDDRFYGDRAGRLQDPFGHVWVFATHTEDVGVDEMRKRFTALSE